MDTDDLFVTLVEEALQGIPQHFQDALHNVEIVIEDWPDFWTRRLAGVPTRYNLLGFYHGVPLTKRTTNYNLVTPDKISIYQRPIEAQCRTVEELRQLVIRVVRHEVAHYFGIDDYRLDELGAY